LNREGRQRMKIYFHFVVGFFGFAATVKLLAAVVEQRALKPLDFIDFVIYIGLFIWGLILWLQ